MSNGSTLAGAAAALLVAACGGDPQPPHIATEPIASVTPTPNAAMFASPDIASWLPAPGGAAPLRRSVAAPEPLVVLASPAARALIGEPLERAFEAAHPRYDLQVVRSTDRQATAQVAAGSATAAIVLDPPARDRAPAAVGQRLLGHHVTALVANPGNPIRSLAHDDVRRLLTGQVCEWDLLSSGRGPVELVLGQDGPRSTHEAAMLIPGDRFDPRATRLRDDAAVLDRVAHQRNALGVVRLVSAERARGTRVLHIDGQPPSSTPAPGSGYHAAAAVRLLYRQPPSLGVSTLLSFLDRSAGRAVLRDRLHQ